MFKTALRHLVFFSLSLTVVYAQDSLITWPAKYFNPKAQAGDFVLPLPCGGGMTFRRIEIPSVNWLDDRKVVIGGTDERFGFSENSRYAYLAGGITDADNPTVRYFLIGKYEVTRMQFDTLGAKCPRPSMKGRLPAVSLSWFDAIEYAHKLTLWLYANARDRLPDEEGQLAFLRLPSETEWEYAARGGVAVSEAEFQDATYPIPEGLHRHVWFQGPRSANSRLQLTGLLLPNPLGLHDVLGNASEIVLEPFRLNKLSRLHGQAGGYVAKGGDFLTSASDIRSSNRLEIAHYDVKGPKRIRTVGFRLVISSPVITSHARLNEIKKAWERLPASLAVTARTEKLDDPVAELSLINRATNDPDLRQRLKGLERTIKANLAAYNQQLTRAAKGVIRLGAFLGRKIKDDVRRVMAIRRILKGREEAGSSARLIAKTKRSVIANENVLDENLDYYVDIVIQAAQEYPSDLIASQLESLRVEFQNRDLSMLLPLAKRFVRHTDNYRTAGIVKRDVWLQELATE